MGQIVDVGREGRVTLPAAVRRQLQLAEGSQLEVAVEDGRVVLTPLVTVPRSVLAQLARHAAEGKVYRGLSRADLERLAAGEEVDLEPFAVPRESFSAGADDVDGPDTRR
jgi:AbrB family looped-hinge helix DNA binding protein